MQAADASSDPFLSWARWFTQDNATRPVSPTSNTSVQQFANQLSQSTDPDTIARAEERPVYDIPGDGMRYVRDAVGVDAVVVNGVLAYDLEGYKEAHSGRIV